MGNPKRIERLNYGIGGVLVIVAALTSSTAMAAGVAVGVAISCLNFMLLRRLVTTWTTKAAEGTSTTSSSLLMVPKTVGLMLLVTLCLIFLPISPIGFAIGFSVFVVSIVVEMVLSTLSPEKTHG
jgi:hypothetical protein